MSLDSSVGTSTSMSYASVAYADNHFSTIDTFFDATWGALSTAAKEALLRLSTQSMNSILIGKLTGSEYAYDQNLLFPRYLPDSVALPTQPHLANSTRYPFDSIHSYVFQAQMAALVMLKLDVDSTTGAISGLSDIRSVNVVQELAQIEFFDSSNKADLQEFQGRSISRILALLKPWLSPGIPWRN